MVSLKQATKAVITDSVDSDRPLTAAAESVNALCYRLEAALCHGLQGGLSPIYPWCYLSP